MKTGKELVAKERKRVLEKEGWTRRHDDCHSKGELLQAALCYLGAYPKSFLPKNWPWRIEDWKPKDRLSNLVRGGQLIQAERERLARLQRVVYKTIDWHLKNHD